MTKQVLIPKENPPMDRFFIAERELYKEIQAKVAEEFGKEVELTEQ